MADLASIILSGMNLGGQRSRSALHDLMAMDGLVRARPQEERAAQEREWRLREQMEAADLARAQEDAARQMDVERFGATLGSIDPAEGAARARTFERASPGYRREYLRILQEQADQRRKEEEQSSFWRRVGEETGAADDQLAQWKLQTDAARVGAKIPAKMQPFDAGQLGLAPQEEARYQQAFDVLHGGGTADMANRLMGEDRQRRERELRFVHEVAKRRHEAATKITARATPAQIVETERELDRAEAALLEFYRSDQPSAPSAPAAPNPGARPPRAGVPSEQAIMRAIDALGDAASDEEILALARSLDGGLK